MTGGLQPLSKFQLNMPHVLGVIGSVLLFLGWSYNNAAKDHPEVVAQWGNSVDWGAVAGVFISLGSVAFNMANTKTQQATIAKAAKSAPVDENGEQSTDHTLCTAYTQAIKESDFAKAEKIHAAITPSKNADLPLPQKL